MTQGALPGLPRIHTPGLAVSTGSAANASMLKQANIIPITADALANLAAGLKLIIKAQKRSFNMVIFDRWAVAYRVIKLFVLKY